MSPKLPRLPPQAQIARWAIKYGPLVLPYAKRLYDQGRFRQLSILHARTLADGTFSWEMVDGDRLWVVWSGDDVVATYPDRPDLRDRDGHPFPAARRERRQHPDEVTTQRARRRLTSLGRSPLGRQEADESQDATTEPTGTSAVTEVEGAVEAELHGAPVPPPADPPPARDEPASADDEPVGRDA